MHYSFDKRTIDNNGHLHVPNCRITKASVEEYFGAETHGSLLQGFAAEDKIPIYRDAAELEKCLASVEAVPLMAEHIISTADNPHKQLIVGAVTNPRWEAPYIVADLTLWDRVGIELIESGEQAELSGGYTRDLDWTKGITQDGLHYVARMFNIKFNHVALVRKGRVPGAVVADKAPEVSMFENLKYPKFVSALLAAIGGEKKAETALALDAALDSEMAKDSKKKPKKGTGSAEEEAGKLLDDPAAMDDDMSEDAKAEKAKKEKEEKEAMDAKMKKAKEDADCAMDAAVKDAETRIHALYAARGAVASVVGDVSLDSAEKVYRFALDKTGVENKDVAADALPALWEKSQVKSGVSTDSAPVESLDISALFPGLGLIRKG